MEAGNGGRGSGAKRSSAKIAPTASWIGTVTGGRHFAIERIILVAYCTVTKAGEGLCNAASVGMVTQYSKKSKH